MRRIIRENIRVLGQLLLATIVLIVNPYIQYGMPVLFLLVLRKAALVAVGAALAHLTWKNLMHYVDTGTLLYNYEGQDIAIKYLGLSIFRGLYYMSWILGMALGL